MIGILTEDRRFYDFLISILSEHQLGTVDASRASLVIVDLDSVKPPRDAGKIITVSSNIFEESDLTRPFLQSELIMLCKERLGVKVEREASLGEEEKGDLLVLLENSVRVGNEEILLTPAEYRLLSLLYRHRLKAVSLADCEAVCRVRASRGNSVSVTVASLRKKLDYRFDKRMIVSLRGQGYCLMI